MPTAHLVHGFLGAGKTTFARRLERELGEVVRFSPDEWMPVLYDGDPPLEHFADAFERVCTITDDTWQRVLRAGVDVILDFGFWRRALRDRTRMRAAARGSEVIVYSLRCEDDVARGRFQLRHAETNGDFSVTTAAYDSLKMRFEPLGTDEPFVAVDTTFPDAGLTTRRP